MAKKLGKFLAATAVIGTAIAGGIALFNKYKANEENLNDDFMDFDDDFDDDLDDDLDDEETSGADTGRSYVNISYQEDAETESAEEDADESDKKTKK